MFGWIKSAAGFSRVNRRERPRVDATFTLSLAAYSLIHLPKLLAAPSWAAAGG